MPRITFFADLSPVVRRTVLTILVATAVWSLAGGLLGPVFPIYIASIGGHATDIGIAGAAFAAGMAVLEPFWGYLADRAGPRIPLAVSQFLSGLVFVGFLISTQLLWIDGLQFGRGLSSVAMGPIGRSLLGALLPASQRGTALGMWYTLSSIGGGGTGFFGGAIVDRYGYPTLFAVCAALTAGGGLIVFLGLPARLTARQVHEARPTAPGNTATTLHLGRYITVCVISALAIWATNGFRTFLPLYLVENLGLTATGVGGLFSIAGIANAGFGIVGGRLADRFGRQRLLIGGLLVTAVTIVGIASDVATSFWAVALLLVVNAAGSGAVSPARTALLADLLPAGRSGLLMGIYGTAEDLGIFFGPLIGGLLWDHFGPATAFVGLAAITLLAALGTAIFVREKAWAAAEEPTII